MKACFDAMTVKETTRIRYRQSRRLMYECFGERRTLDTINPRDADNYRSWLETKGYAPAKIAKEISIAKMFMRRALRWQMIVSNPFEGVVAGSQTNRERLHYLEHSDTQRLLDAAPDADWRCIIALARYGGLRCPSEVILAHWADVDWASRRLRVRSPKTERHLGKSERIIPLFPELHEVLLDAFELADSGAEFVVSRYRDTTANLRTQLLRIIDRAGLEPWPRLFNAMRASRATELAAEYPAAVCTSWLGHTQAVAETHYHMVRDSDFDRATGVSGAESGAHLSQKSSQQQAAEHGEQSPRQPKTEKGPSFTPVPASAFDLLPLGANGPGQT
jgi:integrase